MAPAHEWTIDSKMVERGKEAARAYVGELHLTFAGRLSCGCTCLRTVCVESAVISHQWRLRWRSVVREQGNQ